MQIWSGDSRRTTPAVVTIGNFDGVHRGHQALIMTAQERARRRGQEMLAMTFEPHPVTVLKGMVANFLLTPGGLKAHYLERAGVENLAVIPFTPAFAAMEPERFLDAVLKEQFQASTVVVGFNFSFGRGGRGNAAMLEQWGERHGIEVVIAPPYVDAETHQAVSSTMVRQELAAGAVDGAERLLGHAFSVEGPVLQGDQRGRAMEVPTLNLKPPAVQVMPPYGVYAGWVAVEDETLMAVANWGVRPTFGGIDPILEAHALEPMAFGHYGQTVRFDFCCRLREERKFDTTEALVGQIAADVQQARELLASRR